MQGSMTSTIHQGYSLFRGLSGEADARLNVSNVFTWLFLVHRVE